MENNRIPNQIDSVATRRFAGCLGKLALVFAAAMAVLALVLRHSPDKPTRTAVALAVSGVVFGFGTSILTARSRVVLRNAFVVFAALAALAMFVFRTLFGYAEAFPLRLVLAPLFLPAGYLLGQIGRKP